MLRTAPPEAKKSNLSLKNTLQKLELLFLVQEKLGHRNMSTDVCQSYGYERLFHAQFSSTQTCQKQRIRTRKSEQQFSELEDDSTEIYNSNTIETDQTEAI